MVGFGFVLRLSTILTYVTYDVNTVFIDMVSSAHSIFYFFFSGTTNHNFFSLIKFTATLESKLYK